MTPNTFHRSQLWVAVVCLTLGLLCLSAVPCSAQTPQDAVGAIVIGNVWDAVSTERALQRPGLREGNPFLGQSRPQRLILKSASTAFQGWIVYKLDKSHPKLAKVVGYSAGAVLTGIAVRNTRMGR